MEEGQAIESRFVSRRIEAAQKKVEERNFDIRKNLLEYDEVMDHQRKRIYGYRQEILEGANCKMRILDMLDEQINQAVDKFLEEDYGASCFAEFASNRLSVDFDAADFERSEFTQAEKTAREKASRMIPTQIHEAMDENLSSDVESKEWNWQAMAHFVHTRWGLKYNDRQLKQIGRDNLAQQLIEEAEKTVADVELAAGQEFLEANWGLRSICDWARHKFQMDLTPDQLEGKEADAIKELLHAKMLEIYRQKEIEFPVKVGMARFMADRAQQAAGGHRYDREGLYRWARQRFSDIGDGSSEEDFRTQSRSRLQETLLETSRKFYPAISQQDIDGKLAEVMEGTKVAEPEDAKELTEWARTGFNASITAEELTGITQDAARQLLWNAFDDRFRPEMHQLERSLLLSRLDASWKNHLYTMDHLRSGIGLVGYAQVDPKTEYKRQGMKEFDAMWEGVQNKVTDTIFRMEEEEVFQESLWEIGSTVHESAPRHTAAPQANGQGQVSTNSSEGAKKAEPIRNRGERVGRNDPCPCGSGKKYKNCHMRQTAS